VTQVDLDAAAAAAAERPGRRLVVVRHGQTAWNAAGRAQGHADIELDDAGHAQAAAAAPYLASLEPSALWTSDLARARQTSEYLEKATGLSSREDARLREFDVGLRQGLTIPEFAARYPAEHAAWVRRDDALRACPAPRATRRSQLASSRPCASAWRRWLRGVPGSW
jgi:glucosyl-3-phosphoglycerate phosphatase